MKRVLQITIIGLVLSTFIPSSHGSNSFHRGGEGFCDGCHVTHGPSGSGNQNSLIKGEVGTMLRGSDASSTCLLCHSEPGTSYNVLSNDGSMYLPGGDFYWLKKTFIWRETFKTGRSEGDQHGHNIVASDYGLNADYLSYTAPGGDYPSYAMGCTSCHDPHATAGDGLINSNAIKNSESGNYMLLGGVGYTGGAEAPGTYFTSPAPVAEYNTGSRTETDSNHPAYGSGMSEWCGNCHDEMLFDSNKHPSGNSEKLSMQLVSNYNSYVRTGDFTGEQSSAYLSLVPFERGTEIRSLLDPTSRSGPDYSGNANVMCLTCHRAHASAFENIGRWDFKTTLIADSHPGYGDSGVTGNDVLNSYYGRDMMSEFGKYQRQFCNKCHALD